MPRATLDTSTTVRKELKTLEQGYVVLRRMSYGDILQRRAMQMQMTMALDNKKNASMDVQMDDGRVSQFEFSKCIVEHNLTDDRDRLLNLSDPVVFRSLDPQIGQEIEGFIEELNNWEKAEEDFRQRSEPLSSSDGAQDLTSTSPSS
jgi:hypothetical protein